MREYSCDDCNWYFEDRWQAYEHDRKYHPDPPIQRRLRRKQVSPEPSAEDMAYVHHSLGITEGITA